MAEETEFIPETPTVLIVEDEPRLRDLLQRALPDMGMQGRGVGSAEQALKMMEQEPHAILILDINLPGMSGLELLEKVRERWPKTRAVVLTGYGDLDMAKQAIRLDVDDFLTKPTPLGDLERALDRARKKWDELTGPKLPKRTVEEEPPPRDQMPMYDDDGQELEGAARTLAELERKHILESLSRNDGNREKTANELGISVRKLYYRLAEYQKQGFAV
jgi:DNA-binding NtrC family response regulator